MAQLQAILKTTARDTTDDLRKHNQRVNKEQPDAVNNFQIKFNEQQVESKKAKETEVFNKTTRQVKQRSIHSTCIRPPEHCEIENSMATQTKRNQPNKDTAKRMLYKERLLTRRSPPNNGHETLHEKPTTTGSTPVQLTTAELQAMMTTTARNITKDLLQQHQQEMKLQQVEMSKLSTHIQALQQQVERLEKTQTKITNMKPVENLRAQRQHNIAQKIQSGSTEKKETQTHKSITSVVTTTYAILHTKTQHGSHQRTERSNHTDMLLLHCQETDLTHCTLQRKTTTFPTVKTGDQNSKYGTNY
jgi:hypothetical protein